MNRFIPPSIVFCLTLLASTAVWAQTSQPATDKNDPTPPAWLAYFKDASAFQWKINSKTPKGETVVYDIDMTSQVWQTAKLTNKVQVIAPKKILVKDAAALFVTSGLDGFDAIVKMAEDTGVVIAVVGNLEPTLFGQQKLGGYCRDQYIKTGDPLWLFSVKQTASLIRGMDVVEAMSPKEFGSQIKRFIVTGHSRFGAASWHVAAMDTRVVGLMPIGSDMFMNMPAQPKMKAMLDAAGGERERQAILLGDPYTFRHRIKASILIVSGTNDEHCEPESVSRYWDGLDQSKSQLYMDNQDHGKEPANPKNIRATRAFISTIAAGKQMPKIDCTVKEEGGKMKLRVTADHAVKKATLWSVPNAATNPNHLKWEELAMASADGGKTFTGEIAKPATGRAAAYAELEFELDGQTYSLTTGMCLTAP